jgi:hypothetical protein
MHARVDEAAASHTSAYFHQLVITSLLAAPVAYM